MHTVKIRLLSVILLFSVMLPVHIQAQDSVSVKKPPGYLASYWNNGTALLASPFHWKSDEWSKAGAALVITGVVIAMDEPIAQPFFNWQTNTGKAFGDVGYTIGSVPFQLGITAVSLGVGALSHNQPLKDFALDNLQAQVFTGGITLIVKELAQRERPITGNGAYAWHGPFAGTENASFFSGHSSVTFSTATMIFLHSRRKWWMGLLTYGIATGVAVSRMQRQAHWGSDVLLGAIIGSSISAFVYNKQEKRRHSRKILKPIP